MEQGRAGRRVHSAEFREQTVRRIHNGETVLALSRELKISRSVLYGWLATYRREGVAGLSRGPGRLPGNRRLLRAPGEGEVPDASTERVAELERLVGRQAAQISFLKRAFERVSAPQPTGATGGSGSTRPCARRSSEKAR